MAQREIEPIVIADLFDVVKKDHMEAATHPESEHGTDISPSEWARIQRADDALRRLRGYADVLPFFISGLRLGLDAPSVQRAGRELFGREHDRDDDYQGMRR